MALINFNVLVIKSLPFVLCYFYSKIEWKTFFAGLLLLGWKKPEP